MANHIIPEAGFDPSCGDFGVSVSHKEPDPKGSSSIKVEYDEWIDLDHTFRCATVPWSGGELLVTDVRRLLNSANVPEYIQNVSAIDMILECAQGIIKEWDGATKLPSILVRVSSDKEKIDFDAFELEYYDQV